MNEKEAAIRRELNIPEDAQSVLILSQSSHMDWDWLETFSVLCDDANAPYFQERGNKPAFTILSEATTLLQQYYQAPYKYYYSVAEMGFLKAFCESNPDALATLKQTGDVLRIVGGGITSPDNLLPHGECFIRNFLIGKQWVDAALGLPIRQAWIPDDFGHDSQLPVALEAMGLQSAGFARVPGADNQTPAAKPITPGQTSTADQLKQTGLDFVWRASDGSSILAHWMPYTYYCQGNDIDSNGTRAQDTNAKILGYIQSNQPISPTPYIFIPLGCDFDSPKPQLLDYAANWNNWDIPDSAYGYRKTGVWVAVATFDHYMQLVGSHTDELQTLNFNPTPYFMGFYASRPANKILHHAATKSLLGAEVFGAIADFGVGAKNSDPPGRVGRQNAAWSVLVASTHHDYITGTSGTAYMDVNAQEQLPRLMLALEMGDALKTEAMGEVVGGINATPGNYEAPVAVLNPLGFARDDVVELPWGAGIGALSIRGSLSPSAQVQPSANGGLLFRARVPAFGYATSYLSTKTTSPEGSSVSLTSDSEETSYVLANQYLSATIDYNSGWGLKEVVDLKASGGPINLLSGVGNALAFYQDTGDIYRYGNEIYPSSGGGLTPLIPSLTTVGKAWVEEQGPLRVTLRTQYNVWWPDMRVVYTRTYTLVAGEPFLRMSTTGRVPSQYLLAARFNFKNPVTSIVHGTSCHWDDKPLTLYWPPPVFYPTHDFVLPRSGGVTLAAIYHAATPSWGYQSSGELIGTLLRNTPDGSRYMNYGAEAADTGVHTQHYALRVPTGLAGPESGQPLQEALRFHTPLEARIITPLSTKTRPEEFSLASVDTPNAAILTAAKPGTDDPASLILRVYQPTNQAQQVNLSTGVDATSARGVTALESALNTDDEGALQLTGTESGLQFVAQRALTTLEIAKKKPARGESTPSAAFGAV
jgi:alpha-mannosidase